MADDVLYTGEKDENEPLPTKEEIKLYIMSKMNVSQEAVDSAIEAVGNDKLKVEQFLRQKG